MIFYGTDGQIAETPRAKLSEHHTATAGIYSAALAPSGHPPVELYVAPADLIMYEPQAHSAPRRQEFDWSDARTRHEFIHLEQKVLAKIADNDETALYSAMKQQRNATVFADRIFHDYEEMRRLNNLSKKIAELQQFLRPLAD